MAQRRVAFFEGVDLVDRQAGGEKIFLRRFLVGEGEQGAAPRQDKGRAFPHGQANDGRAEKNEQQLGEVFADGVGDAGGKAWRTWSANATRLPEMRISGK